MVQNLLYTIFIFLIIKNAGMCSKHPDLDIACYILIAIDTLMRFEIICNFPHIGAINRRPQF